MRGHGKCRARLRFGLAPLAGCLVQLLEQPGNALFGNGLDSRRHGRISSKQRLGRSLFEVSDSDVVNGIGDGVQAA